jgi:hypothetical protein
VASWAATRNSVVLAIVLATLTAAHAEEPKLSGSEVIVIEGSPPKPNVKARPKTRVFASGDHLDSTLLRAAPPYSDRAIATDAWTRAWMLLDIDEKGKVTRAKFLKRPGYDLESIAVRWAMALEFDPAIDFDSKPIRSWLVVPLEWPSHGWMVQWTRLATGIPDTSHIPCRGSGPLHMSSLYKTYRDCSPPDWRSANAEPWLTSATLRR